MSSFQTILDIALRRYPSYRREGVVVSFSAQHGFGFIRVKGRQDDVYVHITDVPGLDSLAVGQLVRFDIVEGSKGGHIAKGVEAANITLGRRRVSPQVGYSLVVLALTVLVVAPIAFSLGWGWPISWLVAVHVITFCTYVWDKQAALRGNLRVPEVTLHTMALVGGVAGSFLGQRMLRHKTMKPSFQLLSWIIIVAWAGLLLWYLLVR